MGYKIKFNDYELAKFNTIETVKKPKIMSLYSYMVKYSVDNKLTISAPKLHKMYSHHHYKISLSYFKQLISELQDLDLIIIDKTNKINSYFILREPKKTPEKVTDEKMSEIIDIPNLAVIDDECNKESSSNNNYTNTLKTDFGETVAPIELVAYAKKLMNELRIKSNFVKENVLKKLSSCTGVNRAGMINYILKVITEKKSIQEARRAAYKKKIKIYISSQGTFNNYEQRKYSHQDFIDMEYKLLGWN